MSGNKTDALIENVLAYEEVKNVLLVKEKERDTFLQTSKEEKAKNEEKIQFLRSLNENIRKDVSFYRSGGKHVVSKIFVCRPNEKPLMKNKDLKTSAALMDQKVFEQCRYLGLLAYELQKAQEALVKKQDRLHELMCILSDNPSEAKIREYFKAQSKAELVKMQYQDAVNTSNYYRKIIHCLRKDIFETSQAIKKMTNMKVEKIKIVANAHKICEGASKELKAVLAEIRPLHILLDEKTREYDDALRKKRKEHADQRRDTNAKCMGELKMDIFEDENPEQRRQKELATNIELKAFQDIFEQVKEALDISDVRDVLGRVQEEHARYQRLCDQLEESNILYDNLQDDLDELREQLTMLTYNPGTTAEIMETEENKLAVEAEAEMSRLKKMAARLTEKEKTLAGIKLATVAIHSKLIYIKPPQGQPLTTLVGDPSRDMETIWSKTEKLLARYGTGIMEEEDHGNKELQKYTEARLPEDNLRTVLRPLDFRSRDNLRYDFDDVQASYVSRDDIKARSVEILKPKKRAKPAQDRSSKGHHKGGKGGKK